MSAAQHLNYLKTLLAYYSKSTKNVVYLVGDNCSLNQRLASDMKIPLVGCNSHKLNLVINLYLGSDSRNSE